MISAQMTPCGPDDTVCSECRTRSAAAFEHAARAVSAGTSDGSALAPCPSRADVLVEMLDQELVQGAIFGLHGRRRARGGSSPAMMTTVVEREELFAASCGAMCLPPG